MLLSIILSIVSFFTAYGNEPAETSDYFRSKRDSVNTIMASLTPQERRMAISIVAPEVSLYNSVLDFVELRSLFVLYVQQGGGNFSVGRFQMKPSFVEMLETEIKRYPDLKAQYGKWLADVDSVTDLKEKRRIRLRHLDDDNWQMRYLTMFFQLAKKRTENMKFNSPAEQLKYFATLYNSGLKITPQKVAEMQRRNMFPRRGRQFNYANVAEEFYNEFTVNSPI